MLKSKYDFNGEIMQNYVDQISNNKNLFLDQLLHEARGDVTCAHALIGKLASNDDDKKTLNNTKDAAQLGSSVAANVFSSMLEWVTNPFFVIFSSNEEYGEAIWFMLLATLAISIVGMVLVPISVAAISELNHISLLPISNPLKMLIITMACGVGFYVGFYLLPHMAVLSGWYFAAGLGAYWFTVASSITLVAWLGRSIAMHGGQTCTQKLQTLYKQAQLDGSSAKNLLDSIPLAGSLESTSDACPSRDPSHAGLQNAYLGRQWFGFFAVALSTAIIIEVVNLHVFGVSLLSMLAVSSALPITLIGLLGLCMLGYAWCNHLASSARKNLVSNAYPVMEATPVNSCTIPIPTQQKTQPEETTSWGREASSSHIIRGQLCSS